MKATSILRNITYLTKNSEKTAQFFIDIFDLKISHHSQDYSELMDTNNNKIVFIKTKSEPHSRIGYNPILNFTVIDFDSVKIKLENYPDVEFDGEIKDNEIGKYACIKTIDGIMVGVMELKNPEIDTEEFIVDMNEESNLDANTSEIRNILEKMKI